MESHGQAQTLVMKMVSEIFTAKQLKNFPPFSLHKVRNIQMNVATLKGRWSGVQRGTKHSLWESFYT